MPFPSFCVILPPGGPAVSEIPILSIVGFSGSGKTTLLERLIPELRRRGYRVAVVKHHPHPGLEIDTPGKDTWRLARAGAEQVTLVTSDHVIHRRRWGREPSLLEIATEIHEVDLILTEGFKKEHFPKIEVHRDPASSAMASRPEELVAIVSDRRFDLPVPQFDLDDVGGLADLIEERFLASPGTSPRSASAASGDPSGSDPAE